MIGLSYTISSRNCRIKYVQIKDIHILVCIWMDQVICTPQYFHIFIVFYTYSQCLIFPHMECTCCSHLISLQISYIYVVPLKSSPPYCVFIIENFRRKMVYLLILNHWIHFNCRLINNFNQFVKIFQPLCWLPLALTICYRL